MRSSSFRIPSNMAEMQSEMYTAYEVRIKILRVNAGRREWGECFALSTTIERRKSEWRASQEKNIVKGTGHAKKKTSRIRDGAAYRRRCNETPVRTPSNELC